MFHNSLKLESLNEVYHCRELVKMQILLPPYVSTYVGLRGREINVNQF